MMSFSWIRGAARAFLGLGALAASTFAQNPPARPPSPPVRGTAPAPAPAFAPGQERRHAEHPAGDLPGPIDSPQDIEDTAKMMFKMVDTNNDNQLSQKEATDAGNLLVGGFFFRADANGDGIVSQEEARQARDSLLQQKPMLRAFLQGAKEERNAPGGAGGDAPSAADSLRGLGRLLDANQDKQLQASEVRRAVETSVQSFYQTADTNRDQQLSPSELRAALLGMARTAAQAAFQAADTDHNGSLSKQEFDKSLEQPIHALFNTVDRNHDGQISQDEAQAARRMLLAQIRMLRVPGPGESTSGGALPAEESAPIPSFGAPTTAPPAPAPAPGRQPRNP